jgi:hypothetical protein
MTNHSGTYKAHIHPYIYIHIDRGHSKNHFLVIGWDGAVWKQFFHGRKTSWYILCTWENNSKIHEECHLKKWKGICAGILNSVRWEMIFIWYKIWVDSREFRRMLQQFLAFQNTDLWACLHVHGWMTCSIVNHYQLWNHRPLVSDNEQLRAELQDKREKVDLQNEKMYQLLHSNQKWVYYLSVGWSMRGRRACLLYVLCCEQCHDAPLKTLILTLQQEKAKLGADLSEAPSRVSTLEVSVMKSLLKPFVLETEVREEYWTVRRWAKLGTIIFILPFVLKKRRWQWTSHVVWRGGEGCFGRKDSWPLRQQWEDIKHRLQEMAQRPGSRWCGGWRRERFRLSYVRSKRGPVLGF